MNEYKARTSDEGDEVVCSLCGSSAATVETIQDGEDIHLCPFCYETDLGTAILYKRNDAQQAKQIAQAMNVLLRQLKMPNAKVS